MTPPVPDFVLELRRHVGQAELWMPGITAVVTRPGTSGGSTELLLVRRSDTDEWSPITGILEPGEEPAVGARREAMEEASVLVSVDRLASVTCTPRMTHVNGDRAVYLDHTFACTWMSGDAAVGDDESVDVAWFDLMALPPIAERLLDRIGAAISGETAARFKT